MAPLYDIMSADPHINPKTLQSQKIKLAMAVGESRYYKIKEIRPKHWHQTAKQCKFPDMGELLNEVANAVPGAIETVNKELPRGFPQAVSGPIFQALIRRARLLQQEL